ncbi:hypothetical protein AMELA_G00069500 [Ameiurus melas]|uniref:Uncharacterized protein n=1 Tax=Ameiurus melas TaxID=219545 RepID=A0A7J6B3R8_AMEME|nr:hypothetical protein AMELA_G00069500 [Ameiurus melas]
MLVIQFSKFTVWPDLWLIRCGGVKLSTRPHTVDSIWQPCMRLSPCGLNLTLRSPYKVALVTAECSALFLASVLPHSAPLPRTVPHLYPDSSHFRSRVAFFSLTFIFFPLCESWSLLSCKYT